MLDISMSTSSWVVTLPAKVETPATLKLSKFVCPSTSISAFKSILPENTDGPTIFPCKSPATLPVTLPVTLPSTLPEKMLAVTIPDAFIYQLNLYLHHHH